MTRPQTQRKASLDWAWRLKDQHKDSLARREVSSGAGFEMYAGMGSGLLGPEVMGVAPLGWSVMMALGDGLCFSPIKTA